MKALFLVGLLAMPAFATPIPTLEVEGVETPPELPNDVPLAVNIHGGTWYSPAAKRLLAAELEGERAKVADLTASIKEQAGKIAPVWLVVVISVAAAGAGAVLGYYIAQALPRPAP